MELSTKRKLQAYYEPFWLMFFHPSVYFYIIFPHRLNIKKFPGYFDLHMIMRCISFIPDFEDRLKYLELLINSLNELYSHKSDSDIKNFIKKYRLQDYAYLRRAFSSNTPVVMNKLNYSSKKFGIFQSTIYYRINFLKFYHSLQIKSNCIINNDSFKLVFNKDDFLVHYNSIEKESDKINWCRELWDVLNTVYYHFDDLYYDLLFKKYNLYGKFQIDKNTVWNFLNYLSYYRSQKYSSFKYFLREVLLPFVRNYIEEMDFNMKLTEAEQKYPDKFESDEDKFPVFNFNYQKINLYAEKILKLTKDKIEYYSYIKLKYKFIVFEKFPFRNPNKDTISKIKIALEHLQTKYQLELNEKLTQKLVLTENISSKITDSSISKPQSPRLGKTKKAEHSKLIKSYFNCAVGNNTVPNQKELASEKFSDATWSRYMNDEVFLSLLLQAIEKRKKIHRLSPNLKNLYEALYSDILERSLALEKVEYRRTGQVNKKVISVNENTASNKLDIFDDDEDNKNLNR